MDEICVICHENDKLITYTHTCVYNMHKKRMCITPNFLFVERL